MRSRHVIYGDFNCPYSYLASVRADRLLESRRIELEWRAVEHDPAIPQKGRRVEGARARRLDREIADVVSRLQDGEHLAIRTPAVLPNTALTTRAFAGCHGRDAADARRRLFEALWCSGRNIGECSELDEILRRPVRSSSSIAAHWRASWRGIDRPMVPIMMLPTGWVLRGGEVLEYLAKLARRASHSARPRPAAVTSGDRPLPGGARVGVTPSEAIVP